MYTANLIAKTIKRAARQIEITVEFDNGSDPVFQEKFVFAFDANVDTIKKAVKRYKDALEAAEKTNVPFGTIDLSTVTDEIPTAVERAAQNWLRNFNRLENVEKLVSLGVLTGQEAPVVSLRQKLADDFRPAYIELL